MRNEEVKISSSIEEHTKRSVACYPKKSLLDGEKVIFITPSFSIRKDPKTGQNYGNHCPEIVFAERREDTVITTRFMTSWYLNQDVSYFSVESNTHPICVGFEYHFSKRTNKYQKRSSIKCNYLGKHCYAELGSAMYGDVIFQRLLAEGSAGVWDEIDKAFKGLEAA